MCTKLRTTWMLKEGGEASVGEGAAGFIFKPSCVLELALEINLQEE